MNNLIAKLKEHWAWTVIAFLVLVITYLSELPEKISKIQAWWNPPAVQKPIEYDVRVLNFRIRPYFAGKVPSTLKGLAVDTIFWNDSTKPVYASLESYDIEFSGEHQPYAKIDQIDNALAPNIKFAQSGRLISVTAQPGETIVGHINVILRYGLSKEKLDKTLRLSGAMSLEFPRESTYLEMGFGPDSGSDLPVNDQYFQVAQLVPR